MTASMLVLGALLAALAMLFIALKWVGAAYPIYLGVKLGRAPVPDVAASTDAAALPKERTVRIFLHTYILTALNPKSMASFVGFLPQFLNTTQPSPDPRLTGRANLSDA